jgi:hypothetical protein
MTRPEILICHEDGDREDLGHSATGFGQFYGVPVTRWMPDGERMTLLNDFAYVDPNTHIWQAKAGTLIDGASIPRAFWTVVGSPFTGQYRNASIIHDYYCQNRHQSHNATHFMFYRACRCGGCGVVQAKMLFYAVWHFGPKWADDGTRYRMSGIARPTMAAVMSIHQFITDHNPTIEMMQQVEPYHLPINDGN